MENCVKEAQAKQSVSLTSPVYTCADSFLTVLLKIPCAAFTDFVFRSDIFQSVASGNNKFRKGQDCQILLSPAAKQLRSRVFCGRQTGADSHGNLDQAFRLIGADRSWTRSLAHLFYEKGKAANTANVFFFSLRTFSFVFFFLSVLEFLVTQIEFQHCCVVFTSISCLPGI